MTIEEAEQIYTDIINTSATPNSSYYLNRAECYVNTDRFRELQQTFTPSRGGEGESLLLHPARSTQVGPV